MEMITFIQSKVVEGTKMVLFQTGNYQYEIWNASSKETSRRLYDTSWEQAVAIFGEL
jgi:hypothetical protein